MVLHGSGKAGYNFTTRWVRRGITSLQDGEVTLDLLHDCAEHKRGEKRLKEGASTKKELGKITRTRIGENGN